MGIRFLLLLAAVFVAQAEPPRNVELFGTIGALRGGGDEGSNGSGAMYGGAATIPFAKRWAVDVQAFTSKLSNRVDYRLRRVVLSPALQYRSGDDRAYWFLAFGPGLERDRVEGRFQSFDNTGVGREVSFRGTESGVTLHWRTGGVFEPTKRLLIRGEFFWVNRYVLPNVGVAISVGVRLGR